MPAHLLMSVGAILSLTYGAPVTWLCACTGCRGGRTPLTSWESFELGVWGRLNNLPTGGCGLLIALLHLLLVAIRLDQLCTKHWSGKTEINPVLSDCGSLSQHCGWTKCPELST
jgi:hypothetical protein